MESKQHWNEVYSKKNVDELSWYQASPKISLELISACKISKAQGVIDIGGGASTLVDSLIELDYKSITLLDVSTEALRLVKNRLENVDSKLELINSNVLDFIPRGKYQIWHDRAVFHFLDKLEDILKYKEVLDEALISGGHFIISTFALEGPTKCSGLNVTRYDSRSLEEMFSSGYKLLEDREEVHETPSGNSQKFVWCLFEKL